MKRFIVMVLCLMIFGMTGCDVEYNESLDNLSQEKDNTIGESSSNDGEDSKEEDKEELTQKERLDNFIQSINDNGVGKVAEEHFSKDPAEDPNGIDGIYGYWFENDILFNNSYSIGLFESGEKCNFNYSENELVWTSFETKKGHKNKGKIKLFFTNGTEEEYDFLLKQHDTYDVLMFKEKDLTVYQYTRMSEEQYFSWVLLQMSTDINERNRIGNMILDRYYK